MLFIVDVTIVAFTIGKLLGWVIETSEFKKVPIINMNNIDLN